jgi:hypothetical protein
VWPPPVLASLSQLDSAHSLSVFALAAARRCVCPRRRRRRCRRRRLASAFLAFCPCCCFVCFAHLSFAFSRSARRRRRRRQQRSASGFPLAPGRLTGWLPLARDWRHTRTHARTHTAGLMAGGGARVCAETRADSLDSRPLSLSLLLLAAGQVACLLLSLARRRLCCQMSSPACVCVSCAELAPLALAQRPAGAADG